MRIVVDLQGAQTESRFRGIGRYSLSLTLAMVRNGTDHDFHLVLNGILSDSIEPIRAAFEGLLPPENIHVWYAPAPVAEIDNNNLGRRKAAELIREGFIASLKPDIIHISSLFEGYVDDAVTSIARFDTKTPVSVSHFDLIPLINPDQYLNPNPGYKQHYLGKIDELQRASLVLSISDYSRAESVEYLAVDEARSVNVSTAIDDGFHPLTISPADGSTFLQTLGITKPFVLYTGGSDERKNLTRMVQAYAALPDNVRGQYQIVFAGKIPSSHTSSLINEGYALGLEAEHFVFLGYVSEQQLVMLYNLCRVFLFPSWHEGFGLPPLEAMACGAATIGSRSSSIPEVIGWDQALFDPYDVSSMSAKLHSALEDESFRAELINRGLARARLFTWDHCGLTALSAFESFLSQHVVEPKAPAIAVRKRLAFVSPLPPERTGIAGYAADLLPELHKHYDIELVLNQNAVADDWALENCSIRDSQWLLDNAHTVDRVVYQMGNSVFHQHMLDLMRLVPGVVVLHDFFYSGLKSYLQDAHIIETAWDEALYYSHGYIALIEKYSELSSNDVRIKYPVNLEILQQSLGVILHSDYSKGLVRDWYGEDLTAKCDLIPLLRQPVLPADQSDFKQLLGFDANDLVVCSFGFLDPTKMNHSLVEAWVNSSLAQAPHCKLVFVGDITNLPYRAVLDDLIASAKFPDNISITGWTDNEIYNSYLGAVDVAVQLRAQSRGETSAAVLDCMNYGAAVIANANGSFAELDQQAVMLLEDEFAVEQLKQALELMRTDPALRETLGAAAAEIIHTRHSLENCANLYFESIEKRYEEHRYGLDALLQRLFDNSSDEFLDNHRVRLADCLSQNFPVEHSAKTIYLDITATQATTLRTGIERVALAVMLSLLKRTDRSVRFEPVYLCKINDVWGYKTAAKFTLDYIGAPASTLNDEVVIPQKGDTVLTLDWSDCLVHAYESGYVSHLLNNGVKLYATVFDLLPVMMPQYFPPMSDITFERWLQATSKLSGVICISKSVADEYRTWSGSQDNKHKSFSIDWFHLGADLSSAQLGAQVKNPVGDELIERLKAKPTFLMVGTIEPRKGHLEVLESFDALWSSGTDVNLVIVGKEGWKNVDADSRRNLPEIVSALTRHPEFGKRLLWLSEVGDAALEVIYATASCLVFASEGEGFGLPLIEAAQKSLPIIARDLPIFREVAGDNALYFTSEGCSLREAVTQWLELHSVDKHPQSNNIAWLTWQESAESLIKIIC